jgi:hypothetical protein
MFSTAHNQVRMRQQDAASGKRLVVGISLLAYSWGTQPALAQCEAHKFGAPDSDKFGYSLATGADYAATGAYGSDFLGSASGAVYVLSLNSETWEIEAVLLASDAAVESFFGWSVAADGDVVVAGAPYASPFGSRSGSAYVFERIAGVWTQTQQLLPSDGDEYDLFGYAVAVSGHAVAVGARDDEENGGDAGSVYVFEQSPEGTWAQAAKLVASDGEVGDRFGYALALDGDTLLVGAPEDDDLGWTAGAAYVFERGAAGDWVEAAKLHAADSIALQGFGYYVALSGATALVGAADANGVQERCGAAYVFDRTTDGGWIETQKLIASDGRTSDFFGWGVAIDGGTALIGAAGDNQFGADDIGSTYVFQRQWDGAWLERAKLYATDHEENDMFGSAVALRGSTAIIGAYGDDDFGNQSGAAYVFDLAGHDCNANDRCDSVDIQEGSSPDANANGWPDECEAGDCAADLDADGDVDLADLSALLSNFGLSADQSGGDGDLDGDSDVDLADLSALLTEYGLFCP